MIHTLKSRLTDNFPQNFIIRRPLYGALLTALFIIFFALLYKPLGSHASRYLSYSLTMAVYALISAAALYGLITVLKLAQPFSTSSGWSLLKELLAILLLLTGIGVVIYFAAFFIEEPADRWNFSTFFDSLKNAFLVGILPFLFFTAVSYLRHNAPEVKARHDSGEHAATDTEKQVRITSQLKKESLVFYPGQLIYAESESNYVNFYLQVGDKVQKKVIRNSITDVEKQLAHLPYVVRTHRAFIVNLGKISSRKGNSLGYRLKLAGVDTEIPVSRNKTHHFSKLFSQHD
jgi:DNA-binding LytR/AlgR family response regulator